MNDFEDDYNIEEIARQKARRRKRHAMKMKRLRQKRLRKIKAFLFLIFVVFIVCVSGVVGMIRGGDSELKDSINERETLQVAVDNIKNQDTIQQTTMSKVEKSSN